jgi:hypothetical protein
MVRNQRTTSRRSPQRQSQVRDNRPNFLPAALGIAGGIGIGAGLMYLLDPASGRDRRTYLAGRAGGLAHTAWDAARERAADASSTIAAAAPVIGQRLMDQAHDAREMASGAASGWIASARSHLPSYSDVRDKISSYVPSSFQSRRRNVATIAAAATGAGLAALAIGATAMWLFDPEQGRSRRAWVGQKLSRAANETGQFMRATGRHLSNKGRGAYHETRSAAQHAMENAAKRFPGSASQWTAPNPTQDPSVPST